ncbi:MAG TPA: zinc ribbon domain-containing protein [Candidatus Binataceae bacterium]|nr:zinc ribbon domain-containing protein [Candidatus Binataceae bacterium]
MPIYEYKCSKCGVVEVMQGIKEAPLKKCPNCKRKVERMMSSTSFVLKGTGWYATDYGKKTPPPSETTGTSNGTNGTASEGDGAKSSGEKSASSSETKSAPTTEKSKSSEKTKPTAKSESSSKSD